MLAINILKLIQAQSFELLNQLISVPSVMNKVHSDRPELAGNDYLPTDNSPTKKIIKVTQPKLN